MNTTLDLGRSATSINISERGVYFKTQLPVFVGEPVRVLLQMPSQCGGKPGTRVVFSGRASHVAAKRASSRNLGAGVGVEFFYSQVFTG